MKKKLIITETQLKMLKENDVNTLRKELFLAMSSLTFIVRDFMENGEVDPYYMESIQKELNLVNAKEAEYNQEIHNLMSRT